MVRPPLMVFLREDDDDAGMTGFETKKGRDWALRRAEQRRREEWLDSCSDPPDESVLYGESFVLDGERVGEWEHVREWDWDTRPKPGHSYSLKPMSDEERAELIAYQHREEKLRQERKRAALKAERREQWAQVKLALAAMEKRDEKERKEEARRWRIRRGEMDTKGRTLEYPFGPPVKRKTRPPSSPIENGTRPPRPLGLPQSGEIVKRPRPVVSMPERERGPVRITSRDGIEHIVPLDVYEKYGVEAVKIGGIDPPLWVLHRLGIDLLPGHD
jgi:hypothetical protein